MPGHERHLLAALDCLQCRKRQPDKVAAFRAASEPEQEQLMLRQA